MVQEAGINPYLHPMVVDAITEENSINGVIVESKSGREALLAKVIIDASGDADVAAFSGAPFKLVRPGSDTLLFRMANVEHQKTYEYFKDTVEKRPESWPTTVEKSADHPTTFEEFERNWLHHGFMFWPDFGGFKPNSPLDLLVQKAIQEGEFSIQKGNYKSLNKLGADGLKYNKTIVINNGTYNDINELDVRQVSGAELEARILAFYSANFLKKYVPGFENAFVITTAPNLGVRWTRMVEGEYVFSAEDRYGGGRFDDVIAVGTTYRDCNGTGEWPSDRERAETFEIPYRLLLPKKIDNLLIGSGKTIPAEPIPWLRLTHWTMALGEAAGTAAAISARLGVTPRSLDIRTLQNALVDQGVFLPEKYNRRKV